jgi:hypothetical protein
LAGPLLLVVTLTSKEAGDFDNGIAATSSQARRLRLRDVFLAPPIFQGGVQGSGGLDESGADAGGFHIGAVPGESKAYITREQQ